MSINALLTNPKFMWCAMAIIIFLLTNVIKIPIKYFTKRIQDQNKRKMANTVILLIPFIVAFPLNALYCNFFEIAFSTSETIKFALTGISIYGFIERFFKVKVENPYETTEGENVIEGITELTGAPKTEKPNKDEETPKKESAIDKFLTDMELNK